MRSLVVVAALLVSAISLAACSLTTQTDDLTSGGPRPVDAGQTLDTTVAPDTSVAIDSTAPDTTMLDGTSIDGTTIETTSEDTFVTETFVADTNKPDTGPCPTGKGPSMILVDDFCIDRTEVTQTQYSEFLKTLPPTSGQPPACGWNTSYVPDGWAPGAPFNPPSGDPSRPVTAIDWCDAFAYCKWAGKKLCGSRFGGSTPFMSHTVVGTSKWFAACSNLGTTSFPYGNTYAVKRCNGTDYAATDAITPPLSTCNTDAGVLDMSGNVAEWEDCCEAFTADAGATDNCRPRGGSYNDIEGNLRCASGVAKPRNLRAPDIGFRCCSGP